MNRLLSIIMALAMFLPALGVTLSRDPIPVSGPESGAVTDSIAATDSTAVLSPDSTKVNQPAPRVPRKATPVDIDDNKREPVLHFYDKHGEPLEEPVLFLATLDTVAKPKAKPVYPVYNGISVGVNFGDAIMMVFGQKYGSYDVWADISLWNWLFPVVEAGVGFADTTPDNKNFSYKVDPSFYCKLGFNYNFLYKSNPAYQVFLGFRAGFSSFKWSAYNIGINSSYWQDDVRFDMTGMRSTAWWGEALAGLKVKIVGNFSLGWNVRWHFPFSVSKSKPGNLPSGLSDLAPSKPWFIPGYGGNGSFTFAFSAIWTIPAPARHDKSEQHNVTD